MTPDRLHNRILQGRLPSLLAALLFILALAPIAGNFIFFHPDETFYTNATISMMQTGDVLTPTNGRGELRFNKPILTYWALLGSYETFGVNGFATRLPFLVAGALAIWLTYQLTMLLFSNRTTALIASLITASHPLTISAAIRANPDMLMSLFLLVSVYGIFSLLLSDQQRNRDYYLAYLGFGLAFAVKGPFPVVVFAAIGLLFLRYNPWKQLSFAKIIHLPAMAISLLVAMAWFVTMFAIHGAEGMGLFLDDHVSGRVSLQWGKIIGNLVAAAGVLVLFFLPWNLILMHLGIKGDIKRLFTESPVLKIFAAFAALWCLAMIAMSGPVGAFFPRYLLPVIPLPAILIAYAISQASDGMLRRWGIILTVIVVLLSLPFISGAMLMALAESETLTAIAALVLLVIGISTITATLKFRPTASLTALFATILLLLPSLFLFARPFALPDQGTQIAVKLEQLNLLTGKRIAYLGEINPAAKIRIAAGPQLKLQEVDTLTKENMADFDALIFLEKKRPENLLSGYEIELAARSWSSPPLEQLMAAGSLQQAAKILSQPDQTHYVAWSRQR